MNPNVDKLPVPDMNVPGNLNKLPAETVGMPGVSPEKFPSSESLPAGVGQSQTSALPDPAAIALPTQQVMSVQPSQTTAATAHAQSDSDDDMSIEKECISKAKVIVQQTSTDPYTQAREIGKVKAELLKRRYGKELKLSEG
jgi:hypothetical protein